MICLTAGILRENLPDNVIPEFSLKPNPASDEIIISLLQKQDGICTIEIVNLHGAKVLQKSFNCTDETTAVNTSTLTPGAYMVIVKINDSPIKAKKLIIAR